ncbi:MAG: hypothetical protein Q7T47_04875 [Anaerolineales bacterium]|nr:hypothetical protein [Anaerolineales bacterium]
MRRALAGASHILVHQGQTMQPVQVEVISPLPEGWGICLTCEAMMARANMGKAPYARGLEEYPPDWQEDFQRLSALILDLAARYGENILIRIWDPRSLQGMFKAIRYGVRRYPTFIVEGQKKIAGWDAAAIEQALLATGII